MGVKARDLAKTGASVASVTDDLDQAVGAVLADAALETARARNPTRSRVLGNPIVSTARAVLAYGGVTTPAGFTRAVTDDTETAAKALDNLLDTTLERNGL